MSKLFLHMKSKKLSDLMADLGECVQDTKITGVVDDTRLLQAGDAFLCLPRVQDVQTRIQEAVAKKASAIIFIGEHSEVTSTATLMATAWLPNMDATGVFLRRWFETEQCTLPCIGITGTDGKTSTAWMLREVLALHLGTAWSCGTLGLVRGADDIEDLGNTTPSLLTLHTLLALAVQENVGALVLEVSSHGIAQERIQGIPFTTAVWTTIGHDHLEDHGGFTPYLNTKSSFVRSVAEANGSVVANADYTDIQTCLADVSGQIFWYAQHKQADMLWTRVQKNITLTDQREEVVLASMPVADFHAENLAAVALVMKEVFNVPLSTLLNFDGQISTPVGRLEPVDAENQVFIDYAHTAEGLTRCLQSAKALKPRHLLLVFGCGGDRDKSKRPAMGAVAEQYADECWLTSDNPRSEKQADIAADVLKGMTGSRDKVHLFEDRAMAIEQAVHAVGLKDVLVIAGKGHELYMEIKGERLPWSDKASAIKALQKRGVKQCA